MDRLQIRGGRRIEGSVQVRGAKNAALPQIAAALLCSDRLELTNVPDVTDGPHREEHPTTGSTVPQWE